MSLENILKEAVKTAVTDTIALEMQEVVAKETRKALRDHEDRLTQLVREVVSAAIAEMLGERHD